MKAMSISGIVFGILIVVIFTLDLTPLKIPFGQPSATLDIGFMIAGGLITYLGWSAMKTST
ncbi:MAG: hypothetical protein GTO53_09860 [Planctomycetales bacterium]|nr:hypothetical protein [Planctomycetales bacterium]NIM09425.1 hypothetical protein [Planctomycetales bacterium]NIN08903.1 hypothetical protein [Planctomycetales bacterium]NIN78018.1 hypothetical protein [Planctomycetales bacterium]NIO35206.1 hypothetical protein [Planctomycetales bacterium]